jgi:hypothetical protein
VYIYELYGTSWTQLNCLTVPYTSTVTNTVAFGFSVSLAGDQNYALMGAPGFSKWWF